MRAIAERRDCTRCRRKQVAVMADGSLWWHKWPGWGLWSDGGDCKGTTSVRAIGDALGLPASDNVSEVTWLTRPSMEET